MKSLLYFVFLIVMLLPLSCSKKLIQRVDDSEYLIKKIHKKNSWYIIYAEKKDTLFKIISKADNTTNDMYEKISIRKYYKFNLQSSKENAPIIGNLKLSPVGYTGCYQFDKETTICLEPRKGIFDLYFSSNIKGIYFIK